MEQKIADFFFNYSNYLSHLYIGSLLFISIIFFFIPKDIKHCFPVHWALLTIQHFIFAYLIILSGSYYPKSIPTTSRYNIIFENNSVQVKDLLYNKISIIQCKAKNSDCYTKIKKEYMATRRTASEKSH